MINQKWLDKCLATETRSSSIFVDEAQINYKTWGNPSNPIIFLVHGYSANSNWWDFIAPHFCDNYYVVAIDLSGMGDSDHRDSYSQELYSKEILSLCDELGLETINLVAHSMGGPISLNFSDQYKNRVNSLILIDSIVVMPPNKIGSSRRGSMVRHDVVYDSMEEAIQSFRLIPPQPCKNQILVDHIAKHSYKETDGGYILKSDGKIMRTYTHKDLTDPLMNSSYPIYLVYGLMSQIFNQEILDFTSYVGNIPEERIVSIPGGMHHLFIDEPIIFIEKLKDILDQEK